MKLSSLVAVVLTTVVSALTLMLSGQGAQAAVAEAWVQHRDTGTPYGIEQPKVVSDAQGNIIVASSARYDAAGCDMLVVKYSRTNGAVLWQRYYNGPGPAGDSWDVPTGLAVDANGDIVLTGKSKNANLSYDYDYYTAKYSGTNGAILWEKRFNGGTVVGGSSDTPVAVALDGSGNAIVTGTSSVNPSPGVYHSDFYTIKYASTNGTQIWAKRYNGPAGTGADQPVALVVDAAGNVVVTGNSAGVGTSYDYYTAKYSRTDGSLLWEKRYNGVPSGFDQPNGVAIDSSGNVFVTGKSYNGTNDDWYTAKYATTTGALLWEQRYDGPANGSGWRRGQDIGAAIAVDRHDNVVVTGGAHDGNNWDMYSVKYAGTSGVPMWERRHNGPGNSNDLAEAVAIDTDGNLVIAGLPSKSDGTMECYTAKYAADTGAILWEKRCAGAIGEATFPPPRAIGLALGVDGLAVVAFPTFGTPNTRVTTLAYREIPLLLSAIQNGSALSFAWSTNLTGSILQSATTLTNGGDWQDSSLIPIVTNGQNTVTMNPTSPAAFFRLHQP
jgi:hypothetical protein